MYNYKEFCMERSKQQTVLYSPYRTAKRATVLYIVIESEVSFEVKYYACTYVYGSTQMLGSHYAL